VTLGQRVSDDRSGSCRVTNGHRLLLVVTKSDLGVIRRHRHRTGLAAPTVLKDVGWLAERGLAFKRGHGGWTTTRTPRPNHLTGEGLSVTSHYHRGHDNTAMPASGQQTRFGTGPDLDQPGAIGAQVRAVVADYDRVCSWSDPTARQWELTRIGASAVDLLRRLGGDQR